MTSRANEFPSPLIWLIQAIILLAPLPLASNRPLFVALLAIASASALLLWSWHTARSGQGELLPWRKLLWPGVCAGLCLLWCLIQIIPLPAPLAHPIWNEVATQLMNSAPLGTISVDPSATLIGWLKLMTYVILFALTLQLARSQTLASRLLKTIAFSILGYAAYGLVNYAMGNAYILWWPKEDYLSSLTGTFINRNAFAAFCGIGLIACLSLIVNFLQRELDNAPKKNLYAFLYAQARPSHWLALMGVIIILPALMLSNSRAGVASIALALGVFWLALFVRKLLPRKLLLVLALLGLAGIGSTVAVMGDQLMARLEKAVFERDERVDIWRSSIRMIEDAPLTGQGLGTYAQLYHGYRTEELKLLCTRAHSSYLEFAAEIGLPATILWLLALAWVFYRLVVGVLTRRQGQIYPLFALAVCSQAAVHSLVDFSFQIPANAALLAIVLAIGTAQSYRSTE